MLADLLQSVGLWSFVAALLIFGLAPGVVLRLLAFAFHRDDPRRTEMLAELRAVPRWERPFWVSEQIEVAVFEGIVERVTWAATGNIIHRWRLVSGVKMNRAYPRTFEIPDEEERNGVRVGDSVKLFFETRHFPGEKMWVDVIKVGRRRLTGTLANQPLGIPKLDWGDRIKFRRGDIIDHISEGAREEVVSFVAEEASSRLAAASSTPPSQESL